MAKCIFENITPKQAEVLADWFEGQGESDCFEWFEDRGVKAPMTDVSHPGGYCEIQDNGDVVVHCKTP